MLMVSLVKATRAFARLLCYGCDRLLGMRKVAVRGDTVWTRVWKLYIKLLEADDQ